MTRAKNKKSVGQHSRRKGRMDLAAVSVPERVTQVVTEKRYITTEPDVEIRRPATLAQALTEPEVAVVKPKTTVKRVSATTRRAA